MAVEQKDFAEMQNLFSEMRHVIDEQKGGISAEVKSSIDKMNARLDQIELASQRPGVALASTDEQAQRKAEVKTAFLNACRKGYGELSAPERKIMRDAEPSAEMKTYLLSDDTSGGFFAPPDFILDILKNIVLISPIRAEASVRQTTRESVDIGKRTGTPTASWGNEQTAIKQTAATYGKESILTHKLTAYSIINQQDLEDNLFNLEEQLNLDLSEEFARAEGAAFVTGTGINPYPEGLLTNASIASDYSGDANLVTADGLIRFVHNLKSGYVNGAKFFLNRQTLGAIRILKDSAGRYLLQPGISAGTPATILDFPYVEVPDMPAVAAAAKPILFGNMKKAYMVVDRVGMSVQRLDQLFALSDAVGFKARMRVGGQVVLPEAIRTMTIHV